MVKVSQTLIKILAQICDGPIKSAIYKDALLLQWVDFEVQKHIPNVDSSSMVDEEETRGLQDNVGGNEFKNPSHIKCERKAGE